MSPFCRTAVSAAACQHYNVSESDFNRLSKKFFARVLQGKTGVAEIPYLFRGQKREATRKKSMLIRFRGKTVFAGVFASA